MRGRWILLALMAVAAIGQTQVGNLEFCTVTGKVTDLGGEPVPGIKVEIRPATPAASSIPQSELGMTADALPDEQMRDPGRDSEIFAWGTTDGKGRYEIRGVPKPGAYMLIIRNLDDYQRVDAPLSISASVGQKFHVDLTLRPMSESKAEAEANRTELAASLKEAQKAEQAGNLKAAIAQLEKAAQLAEESPIPHYHIARLALAKKDLEQAVASIATALTRDSECIDCWVLQSHVQRTAQDAEAATASARQALSLAPDNAAAHAALGLVLYQTKVYDQAIPELDAALNSGDPDPNVHLFLANSHVAMQHFGTAVTLYKSYLERFPEAPNRSDVERVLAALTSRSGG